MEVRGIERWWDGEILYVQNNFVRLAYAYTDNPAIVGTYGWCGPQEICVEYILRPKTIN
jgi:hypothetical protein